MPFFPQAPSGAPFATFPDLGKTISGRFVTYPGIGADASTAIPATQTAYAFPWAFATPLIFSAMSFEVLALSAGASARVGIYRDNGSYQPGSLIVSSGDISVGANQINTFSFASNLTLSGVVWMAICQTVVGAGAFSYRSKPSSLMGWAISESVMTGNVSTTSWASAGGQTTLADPFVQTATAATVVPKFYLSIP